MKMKINIICLVLFVFLLIGGVSASDNNTQTLKLTKQVDVVSKTTQNLSVSKLKVTIKAPDVKMHYKDGSVFKVTLKDSNKKLMKSAKVKITLNGKTYNKVTDSKGKASINLNLKPGTYNVVTSFNSTSTHLKQSTTSKIIVKSSIKADDFSKYYKSTGVYKAKFYDSKGKLLKNTTVKFKVNSKTYSVKTTKYGVGKLNIDLKPGKYNITSVNSKTSESVTKTLTIKSILQTSDVSAKSGKINFQVKVLNSKGKVSPNKKVTFKIDGKNFTAKTNKTGIAVVSLDLAKGKYMITSEYNGLKYSNQILVSD